MELGWEPSEGPPTKPVPSTPLQLATPKAAFCPSSLVYLTSFCGESVMANLCARQHLKRERKQSALELFICNLQVEKLWHGVKLFMGGSYYFHVDKKKSGRELSRTQECRLCWGAAMQLQESVLVSAMGNLRASLVQRTGDLEGPGQKGAAASLVIPTASDIWKLMGKTRKQREKKQKWKRACRRLLQHVRKALGSYMLLYMGSHVIPTANLHFNSNASELSPPSLLFFSRRSSVL